MKKIQKILELKKKIQNCKGLIFEKENDILSCVKSVGQEGIRARQKQAAVSLLDLKKEKKRLSLKLKELCKSVDEISFKNKKASSKLIADCISNGVNNEDLKELKDIFKSLK